MTSSDSTAKDIVIHLDKTIYDKEALLTSAYAMRDIFSAYIGVEEENYVLTLTLLQSEYKNKIEELKNHFLNELIDQQLRIDLEKKYGPLRELIVKQAFSPLDNLEVEVKKLLGRG